MRQRHPRLVPQLWVHVEAEALAQLQLDGALLELTAALLGALHVLRTSKKHMAVFVKTVLGSHLVGKCN